MAKVLSDILLSTFSFTINDDGSRIEKWTVFDMVAGALISGADIEIVRGTFIIENTFYQGNTAITRTIKGTFVTPDKAEGTYVVLYGSKGPYEGNWEGAPKP